MFGGKPFDTLVTPSCKSKWKSIQNLVGQQVHAWKIVMVVLIDPLDLKIHATKYMAGSVANNVIQIALKCDLDGSAVFIEQGSSNDEFDSDLEPTNLTMVMKNAREVGEAGDPVLQSTMSTQISPILPAPQIVATINPHATSEIAANSPAPSEAVITVPDVTPVNPSKKIKLEVDREVIKDLTRSLNAFSNFLKDNRDSSEDSFEVLEE